MKPSPKTVAIVKQTVPVLVEHGETLTRHFYRRMFEHDPQVKAFFNPAHQAGGAQQRALAGSICAYAQHIDDPAALGDAIELICQKHASLQIKPEHYPIVGKHLLASIREVLGEAATGEVIDAWAEAYGILADVFMERESQIYDQHAREHGWTGFRPFTIERKVTESETITSFYLRPVDGAPLEVFEPGQYLTVRVPLTPERVEGDVTTTMRNYSLSNAPGADHYRISVKREFALAEGTPGGYVSHYLHDDVAEGDTIEVGPPCGEFILNRDNPSDRPLVLLSGGIGITPTLAMLHAAVREQPGRPIYFLHAALNSRTHALGEEVQRLAAACDHLHVHVRYSDPLDDDLRLGRCDSVGFIDGELIRSVVPSPDAEFYYCGPKPFMIHLHRALLRWGVPLDQCHHEFFGPKEELHASEAL